MKAHVILQDGFDDGTINAWAGDETDNAVLGVASHAAYNGSYGLEVNATEGWFSKGYVHTSGNFGSEIWVEGMYWWNTSVTMNNQKYALIGTQVDNAGFSEVSLERVSETTLYWSISTVAGENQSSTFAPFANSWTKIRYRSVINTANGIQQLWINDTLVINATGLAYSGYSSFTWLGVGLLFGAKFPADRIKWRFDSFVIATSADDFATVPNITIYNPQNTTYSTKQIPVSINATSAASTIDKIWFNVLNGTSWVYAANQTYTGSTTIQNFNNGTYVFYAYANNTLGEEASKTVTFTVAAIEPSTYVPKYHSDMMLQVDGNQTKMPNGTVVVLRGVNKAELADDPDGIWMGNTMWTDANVITELNAMKALGVNVIRLHGSIYNWQLGTTDEHSAISQKEALKRLCNFSAARGIWVVYNGYRTGNYYVTNMTEQEPLPYPPYTNNTVCRNEAEFIAWCIEVMSEMRDYGNFVFEPWNEPEGGTAAAWFNVTQQIINFGRAANFSQPIIVQWGIAAWVNLAYPSYDTSLLWISTCGLTDPNGNIIYSNHQYRNHIHNSSDPDWDCWKYADINLGYTYLLVYEMAKTRCLFWGEIGANIWWGGSDWVKEAAYFNNSLALLTANGIGFAGFWWRDIGPYALIDASLVPNKGGQILFNYTMLSGVFHTLTVQATSGGTVNPTVGAYSLSAGTNQTLIASPSSGYSFVNWTITFANTTTIQRTTPTTFVIIDQNVVASAFFALESAPPSGGTSGGGAGATYTVTFLVRQGTMPVLNAQVRLGNIVKLTDASGKAAFTGVSAGTYMVTVAVDGAVKYTSTLTVQNDGTYVINLETPSVPPQLVPPEPPPRPVFALEAEAWFLLAAGAAIIFLIASFTRKRRR